MFWPCTQEHLFTLANTFLNHFDKMCDVTFLCDQNCFFSFVKLLKPYMAHIVKQNFIGDISFFFYFGPVNKYTELPRNPLASTFPHVVGGLLCWVVKHHSHFQKINKIQVILHNKQLIHQVIYAIVLTWHINVQFSSRAVMYQI